MSVASLIEPLANGLAKYLGVDIQKLPTLMIFKQNHRDISKHFLKKPLTEENIKELY